MSAEHTELSLLLDRHFSSRITPTEERALRMHMEASPEARGLYAQRVAAAKLDPLAPTAEARLAQGLGLSLEQAEAPRSILRFAAPVAAALAAAAAIPFALHTTPASDGFASRGTAASDAGECRVHAYKIAKHGAPEPLGNTMQASDELSFSYENDCGRTYLMIYATDAQATYWFHPSWTNSAETPSAIAMSSAPGVHELKVATAHAWKGQHMTLHMLFTDTAHTAQEIDLGRLAAKASYPGDVETELRVEILP